MCPCSDRRCGVMADLLAVLAAYLMGSIPFAQLLSTRRGIDLRRVGSGNVGASNVLRTLGVRPAVLAMMLDAVKGTVAVLIAQRLTNGVAAPVMAGLASMIGHVYPVWLRFRGGKGVATAAGVFAVLAPVAAAAAAGAFLLTVALTRFISVGSMVAALTLAGRAIASDAPRIVGVGATIGAALVLIGHRANVLRLVAGTERRVGQRGIRESV
jgi:acyl phosphate:glycerol-3-phosphate acyltransferase